MMTGYYVIKDGDKELCRSNNIITTVGRRHILNYLADKITDRSRYIGIGIGSSTPTSLDYKLNFEINKYQVYTSTIDYANNTIIMKAQLPLQLAATISELALFPGSSGLRSADSRVITFFNNDAYWTNGVFVSESTNSKINNTSFQISSANGAVVTADSTDIPFDVSGYSTDDSISIAFKQNDANLEYIDISFSSSDTDYYKYRINGTSSIGHRIVEVPLVDFFANPVGDPNDSISKISITVKANNSTSTAVDFDGIRINDNDTYVQETGAVSRAVLSTPIIKEFGRILDLEYRLVIA
jgi:hypothetical protein